jgi:hypothetical protein
VLCDLEISDEHESTPYGKSRVSITMENQLINIKHFVKYFVKHVTEGAYISSKCWLERNAL